MMARRQRRIGFVSTRLSGTDGVSLETRKWSDVLTGLGHTCFYFAGESDWPAELSCVVPEVHFQHPDVQDLNASLFGSSVRSPQMTQRMQEMKRRLKADLRCFVRSFDPDLLIVENALAIPMHVPLGLALTEFIAEEGTAVIAHHHDFAWERSRFWPNAVADYLESAFPPTLPSMRHVVINSIAADQLARRRGARATVIPNVMDFDSPPTTDGPGGQEWADDLRSTLGIESDERLLLQPTRVVPRKGIERAIELAARLQHRCALVVSHASGDEGTAYEAYLRRHADLIGVRIIFAAEAFAHRRRRTSGGRKVYALSDVYRQADLVTYPSLIEGFGNAFLEAVYYRCPIVVNRYDVFRADIEPKGFDVVAFDGFIREETVCRVEAILEDAAMEAQIVAHNYSLGQKHYSYRALERHLTALLDECADT